MCLCDKAKVFWHKTISALQEIIKWCFGKNKALKVGVLIFTTLWFLAGSRLPQNQDIPTLKMIVIYIAGYVLFYYMCKGVICLALAKKNKKAEVQIHQSYQPTINIQQVDTMTGTEFEDFCADILWKNGYKRIRQTKATGDQGIDIIAERDEKRYAIQCKCYQKPVGNHSVMEACSGSVYYGCDVGVVMTNSTFTQQAIDHARRTGVLLWDRSIIRKMLK